MSYDLFFWKGPVPATITELMDWMQRADAGEAGPLEHSPAVREFHTRLLERFPALEDLPDDQVDDAGVSPWSVTPDPSDTYIALNMVWGTPQAVVTEIVQLAMDHGLLTYDPQGDQIVAPSPAPTARAARVPPVGAVARGDPAAVRAILWLLKVYTTIATALAALGLVVLLTLAAAITFGLCGPGR